MIVSIAIKKSILDVSGVFHNRDLSEYLYLADHLMNLSITVSNSCGSTRI